jgi:hypothetical protein
LHGKHVWCTLAALLLLPAFWPQDRETLLAEWQRRLEAQQNDLVAAQNEVQLLQDRTCMEADVQARWVQPSSHDL